MPEPAPRTMAALAIPPQWRSLLEALPQAVLVVDPEGRLDYLNPAFLALWGLPSDCVPQATDLWTLWADPAAAQAEWTRLLAHGQPVAGELTARRADGSAFEVHFTGSLAEDPLGGPRKVLGTFLDLSQAKAVERSLRDREALFQAVMDHLPIGIAVNSADPGLFPTYMNDNFSRFYRTTRAALGAAQADPDAFWRTVYEDPEFRAALRRRVEAQLQQAQKMKSLGSLAGGIAHDMNNVLGAILGLASANLGTQPMGSPAHQAFETIIRAAERGGNTVKSLLSFARQSPAEERELDLNAILREEVRLLEHTTLAKVHLALELASDLRPIRGDAGALTHAIMNLCVNAMDAMPQGGTLTLRTANLGPDRIEVQVADTGNGMAKGILDKALDPFFTTKEIGKGTGLGLALVDSAVRAHHGQLEIQSEPGQGTRVTIRFPACVPGTPAQALAAAPPAAPAQGSLRVLLVDDDELVQLSVQAILEVLGHSVTTAASGEEALRHLEAGFRPEVVILDMNMPGLGGLGTLPRLRSLDPAVPILLATGRTDQTALDLVAAHPGVSLLAKPFGVSDLQKRLGSLPQA